MKIVYPFTVFTIRCWLKIFYGLKAFGLENFPKGPAIIASNHTSYLDPQVLSVTAPEEIYFLARDSLFRFPFFGSLIHRLNARPVNPVGQDIHSFKVVLEILEKQHKVLIFPEGKRANDDTLIPFKAGAAMIAFRSKCPIVPAYVHGAANIWGRDRKFPKLFGKLTCFFGPPIYPENYSHLPKKEAQLAMTEALTQSVFELQKKAFAQSQLKKK